MIRRFVAAFHADLGWKGLDHSAPSAEQPIAALPVAPVAVQHSPAVAKPHWFDLLESALYELVGQETGIDAVNLRNMRPLVDVYWRRLVLGREFAGLPRSFPLSQKAIALFRVYSDGQDWLTKGGAHV